MVNSDEPNTGPRLSDAKAEYLRCCKQRAEELDRFIATIPPLTHTRQLLEKCSYLLKRAKYWNETE